MCVGNEPSLLSVWLQLLQGSVRLANGWETSTRGGVGGGLGFFQPLHLQFSVWKKTHIFLCNSENINSVFNKSNVVSHYILVSVKLNVNLMQKIGEKTSLQRETTLLFTNYLPCMMNILPVSPAFSFSSNF